MFYIEIIEDGRRSQMIEETVFLGLSEIIWQGIFGFLLTIIVAGAVGFISIHWLSNKFLFLL